MGYLLIYVDLDILACILWMVYGSFLVIVFIFSFIWIEHTYYTFLTISIKYYNFIYIIIPVVYYNLFLNSDYFYSFIWKIGWLNYYELLIIDIEEELELLGWAIGFENSFTLFLISILLTMVCICVVFIILRARKIKSIKFFF